MSTITQSQSSVGQQSQTSKYTSMDPTKFNDETSKEWEAIESVRELVGKHVRDGNIQPLDARKGLVAFTAAVIGYEEFRPSSQENLASTLVAGLSKSQSQQYGQN